MLAYEATGQGVPCVLLHAFPLSHAMWRAELNTLGKLAHVITPDLPGFGRSARQTEPSILRMAEAVAELLEHLGIREPVVVAGLSMGGYVAFEFVRQFPQRVRALGLCSTRAAADTPEQREQRMTTAERIRREGLEPLASSMLTRLLGKTSLASNQALAAAVSRQILANDPHGVAEALLAMAQRGDSTTLLASIACPTLIVAGEEDAFIAPEQAEQMQRQIPQAQLAVIPNAGHLVNLEQPAAFHQALERFLRDRVFRAIPERTRGT